MPIIQSKINTKSDTFTENRQHMLAQVSDLQQKVANIMLGGGDASRERHLSRGKLLPRD
ncbi:MAG: 3-methylcrotonyl-CoA carboxylase beta subunit, partial [Glaciecola sp.]